MKHILDVEITTNSAIVYAETGRFPLSIYVNLCIAKGGLIGDFLFSLILRNDYFVLLSYVNVLISTEKGIYFLKKR